MKQYFLRFQDEAQAIEVLALFRNAEGWVTASLTHAVDVVGAITHGGQWDSEGIQIETPTMLDGFHVNLIVSELESHLKQYCVTPATPSRVFAGMEV